MSNANQFDEDYFMRGVETGKSLYTSYHWMPELTMPMVQAIIDHLGIQWGDSILDFGCARGYIVKAFHLLQYRRSFGIDCSEWAIANADPEIRQYLYLRNGDHDNPVNGIFDWVIAKDVLEHIPRVEDVVNTLMDHARCIFAVVPLSPVDKFPYVVEGYEKDVTHIHRLTLASWARMFMRPGWIVETRYRLRGIKDNYSAWANGNGFITARRTDE